MAQVEQGWFRRTMAGQDVPHLYSTGDHPDADWEEATGDEDQVRAAFAAWSTEITFAIRFVDEASSLDLVAASDRPRRHASCGRCWCT
jgi:hypothetical protein